MSVLTTGSGVRIPPGVPGTSLRLASQKTEVDLERREVQYCTSQDSMKFYYIYVLHNSSKNFIYIGYSEDLRSRFISQNKGHNKSTKPYLPLDLIYYEAYKNMEDAKRRELYLKSNRGKTTLKTMLKKYFENL